MENWKIYKSFNKLNGIIAGSTTKNVEKNYSYSLAVHTGEKVDLIELNRKNFSEKFPENYKFITFLQIHSDIVIDVSDFNFYTNWYRGSIEADGMVTNKKEVVLCSLTADCLALLAFDPIAEIIGVAHAGWRGTQKNIAKNLIKKMQKLGAKIENIKVALSPSIKSCCYEVGEEVAKNFTQFSEALVKTGEKKWHLDISIVNKLQLMDLNIKEENIEVSTICTSCQNSDYFSYRKECGCTGRFINFIAMRKQD